jgi:hypothetical protein
MKMAKTPAIETKGKPTREVKGKPASKSGKSGGKGKC